jgi:hypothetical protein
MEIKDEHTGLVTLLTILAAVAMLTCGIWIGKAIALLLR